MTYLGLLYIENSKQAGRNPDFVVMDDSLQPQTQEYYQQMLREIKNQYQVKICYGNFAEKQKFAQSLIKTGDLPADVVNFALFDIEKLGNTTGANRNALMLHTAGEAFFSADDDTICKVVSPLNSKTGLAFTADCSCNFGPGKMDAKTKLRTLGKYLTELGSLPLADFEEFFMLQVWRSQSSFISLMENRLKIAQNSPSFWANDVKKYIELLSKSLTREDYL